MWNKILTFFQGISSWFLTFFQRKPKDTPQPLRIEGIHATLTPQPDDAEMAAAALLESLATGRQRRNNSKTKSRNNETMKSRNNDKASTPDPLRDSAYYRRLSDRIREDRETEARLALRFVAYCEQELHSPLLPTGRIAALERELYRRLDIIEREGGELKRRWQKCLAEVTIRLMAEVKS